MAKAVGFANARALLGARQVVSVAVLVVVFMAVSVAVFMVVSVVVLVVVFMAVLVVVPLAVMLIWGVTCNVTAKCRL